MPWSYALASQKRSSSADDDPEAAAWTVLLLVDAASSSVAVSVGYAVEPFVSDDGWMRAAEEMSASWCAGDRAKALCEFLDAAEHELEGAAARVARLLGGSRGGDS